MRMFAAATVDVSTRRTAVPVEILRRLAFGRPQRGSIQPALPVAPATEAAAPRRSEANDLDQRVRESGEW
ncbi:MAG: hypothetical protein JWQ13_1243 [Ramlibacter sp.]|jgi:hypothetical protein|nr:hypothetical protein [Ramlibacter sp.]